MCNLSVRTKVALKARAAQLLAETDYSLEEGRDFGDREGGF